MGDTDKNDSGNGEKPIDPRYDPANAHLPRTPGGHILGGKSGIRRKDPRRSQHLKPFWFKPGVSGCPGGKRPPGKSMRSRLRAIMDHKVNGYRPFMEIARRLGLDEEAIDKLNVADLMLLSGFFHAIRGKPGQFSEIMQRIDGRVTGEMHDYDEDADANGERVSLSDMTEDGQRAALVGYYEGILSNADASQDMKLKAADAITKILKLIPEEADTTSAADKAQQVRELIQQMKDATFVDPGSEDEAEDEGDAGDVDADTSSR